MRAQTLLGFLSYFSWPRLTAYELKAQTFSLFESTKQESVPTGEKMDLRKDPQVPSTITHLVLYGCTIQPFSRGRAQGFYIPGHSRGPGEKPSVGLTWKVWSEAAGLWTVSTPSPKGETSCIYKSRTSHIHTNNQMKVERPSLLKAVTVLQECKLPGQLQSVCSTMPQNQRVRPQWEDCFRKNRAAPVSEFACGWTSLRLQKYIFLLY